MGFYGNVVESMNPYYAFDHYDRVLEMSFKTRDSIDFIYESAETVITEGAIIDFIKKIFTAIKDFFKSVIDFITGKNKKDDDKSDDSSENGKKMKRLLRK